MQRLLDLPLQDRNRAVRESSELARRVAPELREHFDLLLASSPAPEQGLHYLARFPADRITAQNLRPLIALFTYSHFLAEDMIEHPDWSSEIRDLDRVLDAAAFRDRLQRAIPDGLPSALDLAMFRRRQLLRVVARDVLGLATLPEITGELSALADAIVETAVDRILNDLVRRYGSPDAAFSVIALGKLGGLELNYSSDIDLMFLYSANGRTVGGNPITHKEFFQRAANELTALLSTYTPEGLGYRVDLRLRPDGRLGEVCISLDGARQYYEKRARDWELQMLIKARVAAGDRATGRALLDAVEPRIYSTTLDFSAIEALSVTRERLNEKLAAKKAALGKSGQIDVKLARGGIRDIEFVVQCLQRLHGGAEPWVRHGGTMLALARLHHKDFLSDAEYGRLASAYTFLRHLEHRLQFAEDRQTHTLPHDSGELELLARRMPGQETARSLLEKLRTHFAHVIEIYDRVVHSGGALAEPSSTVRALDVRAPSVSAALGRAELHRGLQAFEHFLERLSADRLEQLDSDPARTRGLLDLFEHSPYFAEELIRTPELAAEIGRAAGVEPAPFESGELRRWYRREMLRIQADSICHDQAIFETLAQTSELADTVISRAYEIVLGEARPADQMWVIALGRLGMREFDLASDADLVFVLDDSVAAEEMPFWTRIAERLISLITAYTGDGVMFAVDTRLRPNGGGGPLVQTESAFLDYFGRVAEAWEGITYMKSRAVAGNTRRAESFLHQLQEADWRRYGQSGRSRTDLWQMRMRLEKAQGASHPLKAGAGGYYDIDFLLMYLRLKSAGIFFKVLNTPERIEVLESMGHLDRSEAQYLSEAATFYRALDHGLRVLSGHAEGRLPSSEVQLSTLAALLARWSAVPLDKLPEIRTRTRAMFDRLFR